MCNSGHRVANSDRAEWERKADQQGPLVSVRKEDLIPYLDKGIRSLYPALNKEARRILNGLPGFTRDRRTGHYIGWTDGGIPVVCASNRHLAEHFDVSESKLARILNLLADCGLISFNDRASRRRGVARDATGNIVERYGIVLSLLKIRFDEIVEAHKRYDIERKALDHLRTGIKKLRPRIRAMLDAGIDRHPGHDWEALCQAYADLPHLPRSGGSKSELFAIFNQLNDLFNLVRDTLASFSDATDARPSADNGFNMEGYPLQNEEVNTDTNRSVFVSCNDGRNCADAQSSGLPNAAKRGMMAGGAEPEAKISREQADSAGFDSIPFYRTMAAFPEFNQILKRFEFEATPPDAWRVAQMLAPELGISNDALAKARHDLGMRKASACIALIYSNRGTIGSPGGYLRAMIGRDKTGELHLDKSIYGRLAKARTATE